MRTFGRVNFHYLPKKPWAPLIYSYYLYNFAELIS